MPKFIGSDEKIVFPSQAVTVVGSPVTGPWVELEEAEMYEFELTAGGGTVTAVIETDVLPNRYAAIPAGSPLAVGAPRDVSLGSLPGGRRVRAVVSASVDATAVVVTAKETRDALG